MTLAELKRKMHFSMDGVVFERPPAKPVAREIFLRSDDMFVWRKPSEKCLPELSGHDAYRKQVPEDRMVPLWGGISWGGFAVVLRHPSRKTNAEDWSAAVRKGNLEKALSAVNPHRRGRPWTILCDNERFLRARASLDAYEEAGVSLWKLPALSPDLNPVERFWAWVRRRMRKMDLADLVAKRPVLGRLAWKARLMRLVRTKAATKVAANTMAKLKRVCAQVKKTGAASGR